MSLWLIGLGASVGYLILKQECVQNTLDEQRKKFESETAGEAATEGIDSRTLKSLAHTPTKTKEAGNEYHHSLPEKDKHELAAAAQANRNKVQEYDGDGGPITGVYLDGGFAS